jgi:hypothetical protein
MRSLCHFSIWELTLLHNTESVIIILTFDPLFHGVIFFSGMEILPPDAYRDLSEIRVWAQDKGYVDEPYQFLLCDRVDNISKVVSHEDELSIALVLHHGYGKPIYFEYPYLPVKSLIDRGYDIVLLYWRLIPSFSCEGENIVPFDEVQFGFMIPGCLEEFCSSSTSAYIVERFRSKLSALEDRYEIELLSNGCKEIVVDGTISAFFTKTGQDDDISFIE